MPQRHEGTKKYFVSLCLSGEALGFYMVTTLDKLTEDGCAVEKREKLCRARGGESCAFDGAMIVLQPIADTAHIVHGPIACCGNSWEGRGTRSSRGALHRRGFTTDMGQIDIVYGSEEKLHAAIIQTHRAVGPKAIFVYSTCVSGLIGEDIDAVCKKAEAELGVRVIPVNAPGFVGPKNLGNRIAGEVLLTHVIGTGEPPVLTHYDINIIGEYNIAGDLWHVEPLLTRAGIRVLARITGDSTFEEITGAHRAKLNVVVCGRALINVAREMERKYGIPFVEVSFFGKTETTRALRTIARKLEEIVGKDDPSVGEAVEALVKAEEKHLAVALKPYKHLQGKKAVLYTGGVKSWSFISALRDLGVGIEAVGTKKSTFDDEEKMKEILGPNAPLVEDVTPKNLLKLLKEKNADVLVAGGRNQYLAVKEGYPFVDVNQERHTAYAGYEGLVNLAEQISNGMRFYSRKPEAGSRKPELKIREKNKVNPKGEILIDPLKHSPAIGAAIVFQGVHNALPIIHGAQGCTFLGKVLLTKHFREPIALATTKLFVENVVMGGEENLVQAVEGFIQKNEPDVVGVLTSGLCEVKGDDVKNAVAVLAERYPRTMIVHVPTPDYDGGLETGYARAVEALTNLAERPRAGRDSEKILNVFIGPHLTPADVLEVRELAESFGLRPVILPALSALDGSRQGLSSLSAGGSTVRELRSMGGACRTLAIGRGMEPAAKLMQRRFGIEYELFESIAGLRDTDRFVNALSTISGRPVPEKYQRQRLVLIDGMRDAHFFFGRKNICIALEPDHAVQTSRWIEEMGAAVGLAVVPTLSEAVDAIRAQNVEIGGLSSITGKFDLLISNSHAEETAKRIMAPLYQAGFPVYKVLGHTAKVTVGYRGTLAMVNEVGNLMMKH